MAASTTTGAGSGAAAVDRVPIDRTRAMRAVADFLSAMGEDPERPELRRTPERVTDLAIELFSQTGIDPVAELGTPMAVSATESEGQLVSVAAIPFRSLCPHHLLPFEGSVDVSYAPHRRLAGFSRVVRLVETVSRRLQLQERMGEQIAQAIMTALEPHGVSVRIEAVHGCVTMLEPRSGGARMITTCTRGTLPTAAAVPEPGTPARPSGSGADARLLDDAGDQLGAG